MREVPLFGVKAAGRVALVDDEDYDLVMQYRWHVREKAAAGRRRQVGPYTQTTDPQTKKKISMHGLISGYVMADHIDHDALNNRRSNLREATSSQNQGNERPRAGGTSRFKGVSRHTVNKTWVARIRVAGRPRYLGSFRSQEQAARAYDEAAIAAWGDFAYPNFADSQSA